MPEQPKEPDTSDVGENAIAEWLIENSVPLQHIEARNGFADLIPFKKILGNAKVVGLGETTHGTHEIFQLKHRLVEFLVVEMGFDVLAIEASYSACQAINDYILHGIGDCATVVTGQGYVVWDIEEIVDLIEWLREHNRSLSDDKKVRFYGLDLCGNDWGRNVVLEFLRKIAPAKVTTARALFDAIAKEEAKWPTFIDDNAKWSIDSLLPQLQILMDDFIVHKADYLNHISHTEFDEAYQYVRVMQQWLIQNGSEQHTNAKRSSFMAENLVYLVNHSPENAKFVVWEHNDHVGKGYIKTDEINMGLVLQHAYGDQYFAVGFEFGQGSFNTREILPDHRLGDLKEIKLDQASVNSLPWFLSRIGLGNLILNLRFPIDNPSVDLWLQSPIVVHQVSWVSTETSKFYSQCRLLEKYDAIAYIENTTGACPTLNGLKTIAARQGL
jgi:erythromycin esterase